MRGFKPQLPENYQQQTYASPYWIVRWPHLKRVRTGAAHLIAKRPRSVLDYGAGDGHVLLTAADQGLDANLVAYEPVELFQDQLLDADTQRRIDLVRIRDGLLERSFDCIICLGVLEHMPLAERIAFYDVCERTLAPGGAILIDVPVEIGPALLVKAAARVVLKGRANEYEIKDLLRAFAGEIVFDPARFDPGYPTTWIHGHKGFDYRLLRREMEARFEFVSQVGSPIRQLPAPLGNQEVFLTFRRRTATGH